MVEDHPRARVASLARGLFSNMYSKLWGALNGTSFWVEGKRPPILWMVQKVLAIPTNAIKCWRPGWRKPLTIWWSYHSPGFIKIWKVRSFHSSGCMQEVTCLLLLGVSSGQCWTMRWTSLTYICIWKLTLWAHHFKGRMKRSYSGFHGSFWQVGWRTDKQFSFLIGDSPQEEWETGISAVLT